MIRTNAIQSVCAAIIRAFNPVQIILFGSHAYGTPAPDSDVDLLVIMPFEGSPIRKAAEVSAGVDHPFPLDILVRTPEFVRQRLALGDFFMREIMERGRVLYDAAHAGVGAKS